MGCVQDKDLTNCLEVSSVLIERGPHYYEVYLWKDLDSMRAASDEFNNKKDFFAFCCHNPYKEREVDDKWEREVEEKLGELHFVTKMWNFEIVSHEVEHAKTHACRMFGLDHIRDDKHEERVAYLTGKMVSHVLLLLAKFEDNHKRNGETHG